MIYHVYANQSNIGDWLSAKGIQKLLGDVHITECFCDEPFVEDTIQVLSAAKPNDLIIVGGGGLFMDYFTPFWSAFQLIASNIPFCIWGVGFCDIKHEASIPPLKLIQDIVSKARLCVVRDELSRTRLSRLVLPGPIACPSICLVKPAALMGSGLLHVVNYSTATPGTYEAMCEISTQFANHNGLAYRQTNNLISKGSEDNLTDTLGKYKQSSIVVSSALHGCIIGVAMGLKVVAVSGDWKIEGFMKSVGLKDWVLNYDDTAKLSAMLQKISGQPDTSTYVDLFKNANEEVANRVRQYILTP